jgi:N6-adenosine-specific RNA methylase IME4
MNFGVAQLQRARVLHVDPPWKFGDKLPGKSRGAARNYPVMHAAEIATITLPPLHDDCLLLLWRVASMQQEALDVMERWGFTLKSEIVWVKLTRGKERKLHFGMGRYTRAAHETCLLGVRGRVRVRDRSVRDVFEAPVRAHSQKPDEIFRIAQQLHGGPYTELFGRAPRKGWQVLGNDPALLWEAA